MSNEEIDRIPQTSISGTLAQGPDLVAMKEYESRSRAENRLRLRFDTFATILSQRPSLSPEQAADAAETVYKKLCGE